MQKTKQAGGRLTRAQKRLLPSACFTLRTIGANVTYETYGQAVTIKAASLIYKNFKKYFRCNGCNSISGCEKVRGKLMETIKNIKFEEEYGRTEIYPF
jgi:hypothetical protein